MAVMESAQTVPVELPETSPRSFRTKYDYDHIDNICRPPGDELKERGRLPRIESEHLPALRRILGMGEGEWSPCPVHNHRGHASVDELVDNVVMWCDCLGA